MQYESRLVELQYRYRNKISKRVFWSFSLVLKYRTVILVSGGSQQVNV